MAPGRAAACVHLLYESCASTLASQQHHACRHAVKSAQHGKAYVAALAISHSAAEIQLLCGILWHACESVLVWASDASSFRIHCHAATDRASAKCLAPATTAM